MFLVLCLATFSIFNEILRDICVGSSSSAIYLADPSTSNRRRRSRGTLDRLNLSIPIPLKVGSVSSRNFSNFSFHGDLSDKISRWKSPLEEISSFPATVDLNVSKPCFNRGTATRIGTSFAVQTLLCRGIRSFVFISEIQFKQWTFFQSYEIKCRSDRDIVQLLSLLSILFFRYIDSLL